MDRYDIAILGFDLNALAIAADAATRGYRVKLIAANNIIGHYNTAPIPIIASRFMHPEYLAPLFLLNSLNEQKILYQRSPSSCQWIPAKIKTTAGSQTVKGKLASFFYQQLYQRHNLPELSSHYKAFDHTACIINTAILMAANRSLAKSFGANIETGMVMKTVKTKGNIWQIDLITATKKTQQIEALSVVNCTGIPVLDVCKQWFGLKSRCQTKQVWCNYISYSPEHVIKKLLYLTDTNAPNAICFPLDKNKAVIRINGENTQSYRQCLHQAQQILEHYGLPRLTVSNIQQQWLLPTLHAVTNNHEKHDAMIDFICPNGVHPMINIIGNNTPRWRLLAEQALNNLTDYLPKCKPCQTRSLVLPT